MPSIRYSLLPLFSTPGSTPRTFLPRGCLSPRMLLATVVLGCILSSLVLITYSQSSFGFGFSSDGSIDEWSRLEAEQQEQQTRLPPQHHGQPPNNGAAPSSSLLSPVRLEWRNVSIASRWSCEKTAPPRHPNKNGPEYNRQTVCTVSNLCVDADRGVWMHDPAEKTLQPIPVINVVASDPGSDAFFKPTLLDHFPVESYRYVEETIFVYGQDPNYKRNWILNGLLPLHSVMSSYGGTAQSWFLRVRTVDYKQHIDIDTAYLSPQGIEIVMGKDLPNEMATKYHPPPKSAPICIAKAVIGLGSACTRPYCEKYLGGTQAETLRRNVLERLETAMARYQQTDPKIVHPPLGDDVPVLREDQPIQKDELIQRRKINVALLGRYGNTSIANAQALELSLLGKGFNAKTIHLDDPAQISMAQAAQLFSDQHILVAPQGDGLGYSTLMAPGTVIVSIMPRFAKSSKIYTDRMMAWGKRFFAWDCRDDSCVQTDRDLAHDCIESVTGSDEVGITAQDYEDFANMRQDFSTRSATWKRIADCYTKHVSRRLNVDELTLFIEDLAGDFKPEEPSPASVPSTSTPTKAKRGAESEEGDQDEEGDDIEQEHEYDDHQKPEDTPESAEKGHDGNEDDGEQSDKQRTPSSQPDVPPKDPTTKPKPVSPVSPKVKQGGGNNGGATEVTFVSKDAKAVPRMSFVEACQHSRCCGAALPRPGDDDLTPCAESLGWFVIGPRSVWEDAKKEESDVKAREVARSMIWRHGLGRS